MSKKARDRKKQLRKDIREYKQYLKNKFEEVEKQVVLHTFLDIKGSEYNFNEPTIKWQTPTPESYDGKKMKFPYFEDEASLIDKNVFDTLNKEHSEVLKNIKDGMFDNIVIFGTCEPFKNSDKL